MTPWAGTRRAQDNPRWAQDGVRKGRGTTTKYCKILVGAFLAPTWAQEGSNKYLAGFCRCPSPLSDPILGPSWAILGPPWPFRGGPRGHLEADLGLRGAAVGTMCGKKVGLQKPFKNHLKINIFCRFLGARSFRKSCKVAVRRSCCGLEGWKRAAWKPSWLQDGVEGAKLSPRWPKLAPRYAPNARDTL